MCGASMDGAWAREWMGASAGAAGAACARAPARLPVLESRGMSLMPLQKEPKASHQAPSASCVIAGSMALNLSAGEDRMTMPRSLQRYAGSAGSSVGLVARPIADVFLPKEETE